MASPAMISGFRASAEKFWLSAIRQYTFHTPIAKGKYRLLMFAMSLCRNLPVQVQTTTTDGRRLSIPIDNGMNEVVYFLGEYEKAVTEIAASLLRPGDVCIDVGANFGWYTTLFRAKCGLNGAVHSFEPVPTTFAELQQNVSLIVGTENVFSNKVALGDREGEVSIELGENRSSGFASISNSSSSREGAIKCRMTTLDKYLEGNLSDRDVNFVKVDIEGAELMFLKGSRRLFQQSVPPMMLIEMALQQTGDFGYTPDDLIHKLDEMADYDHYAVNETAGTVFRIEGFSAEDIGANVFSIPKGQYADRTGELLRRIRS